MGGASLSGGVSSMFFILAEPLLVAKELLVTEAGPGRRVIKPSS